MFNVEYEGLSVVYPGDYNSYALRLLVHLAFYPISKLLRQPIRQPLGKPKEYMIEVEYYNGNQTGVC